jgi:hypothetical protein
MAIGPAESFSHYVRDTNIRFSFDCSHKVHVGGQKKSWQRYRDRIAPSGHLGLATHLQDAQTIQSGQKHPDQQGLPAV